MSDLDFVFEQSPWESYLRTKGMGDTISAVTMLSLLEGEQEQAVEEALQDLETGCMFLDISALPKASCGRETAQRQRRMLEAVEEDMEKMGHDPRTPEENDPFQLYIKEIAQIPGGDEEILAQRCRSGDQQASEALTNLGLKRVVTLAKEFSGYGVLLMDLIQEGNLGLWKAVQSYHQGEYAAHRDRWIRFYMAKAVTLQARANGVGQKMRTAIEDYKQVDERLLGELGRNPTLEEIALELHIQPEEASLVKKMLEDALLLAQIRVPEKPEEEEDAEEEQAVEDTALFRMRQRISDLLSGLDEQDQKLLKLRFGLDGAKPLSPEDTGAKLGLTPEEVVAREAAALSRLRNQ